MIPVNAKLRPKHSQLRIEVIKAEKLVSVLWLIDAITQKTEIVLFTF